MKRAAKCILKKTDTIIEATLQQVDADACEPELRDLVESVAATLDGGTISPDLALRTKIAQDDMRVRTLCALQAAIIEALRPELTENTLRETVLSIRDTFRAITPGLPLMKPCQELQALLEEGPDAPERKCAQNCRCFKVTQYHERHGLRPRCKACSSS